jgi:hypothetical protein
MISRVFEENEENKTMSKYLIEIPHGNDKTGCLNSISVFMRTCSTFLTHAGWSCHNGDHKAWFFMDAGDENEVIRIVPVAYKENVRITQLNNFKAQEFRKYLE